MDKNRRNELVIEILEVVNSFVISNIEDKGSLIKINEIKELEFLDDVEEIIEEELNSIKENMLMIAELEEVITEAKEEVECEISDNAKQQDMMEKLLQAIEKLEDNLFENNDTYMNYESIVECISEETKNFRESINVKNIGYDFINYRNNLTDNILDDIRRSIINNTVLEFSEIEPNEADRLNCEKYKLANSLIIKK